MSLNLSSASSDFADFVEGIDNHDLEFTQAEVNPGDPARVLDSESLELSSCDELNLRKNSGSCTQ
jgi:hypothetical protein